MATNPRKQEKLIELVDKPLGFYVLSLLIVETFLVAIAATRNFPAPYDFYVLLIGVGMFVYVTGLVTILAWWKVENLTFNQSAHLQHKKKPPYGSTAKPVVDLDRLTPTEG